MTTTINTNAHFFQWRLMWQAALTTFEDLQKWQGPEGERLGEPDDPKCSLPFCNALESAVVAVEQCKGNPFALKDLC
jgi:hypothetical protein